MPSDKSDLKAITLRGEPDKLGLALTQVYEKANSVVTVEIEAPKWLHRFIIGRGGQNIKKITEGSSKVRHHFAFERNSKGRDRRELTVGFETNLASNSARKKDKYAPLLSELKKQFKSVHFVNLSISALGIFSNSCASFLEMCNSLSIEPRHRLFLISKLSTIAIRTTYYIFCCRDKAWTNPDLLPY